MESRAVPPEEILKQATLKFCHKMCTFDIDFFIVLVVCVGLV